MVGASFVTAVAEIIRAKKGVTAVGNAQVDTAQSKFGNASALFDGTGDYLTLVSDNNFGWGTGDFTIEGWFYKNAASQMVLFDQRTSSTSQLSVYVESNAAGNLRLFVNGSYVLTSSNAMTTGVWTHIAITRASGTTRFFINGTVSTNTYADTNDYGTTKPLVIGATWNGSTAFNGWIDEFRISNSARYTAGFTAPTAPHVNDQNTVLLLHMNGTDASTYFEDDNGVRAKVGMTAIGNAQIDTAQSKFGGSSLLLDGTGDYLFSASNSAFGYGTGAFTLETWIRFNAVGSFTTIATHLSATPQNQIYWGINSNNRQYLFVNGSTVATGTNSMTTGTWYHLALVRNGSTTTLYFNGTSEATWTDNTNYISPAPLYIGASFDGTAAINGWMDEFRVSNTARYTSNFTAPSAQFTNDANTLLLLHMDGTDATTVFVDDNGTGRSARGVVAVGNAQIDTAQSKFGGASALFDGTGDHVRAYSVGVSPSADFTFEAQIRPANTGTNYHVMSLTGVSGRWGLTVYQNGTTLRVYASSGSSTWNIFNGISIGTVAANTWYHVAVVRSGSTWYGFLNGAATTIGTSSASLDVNGDIDIGAFVSTGGGIESFNGHIDEVRYSNTARYTAGFTAPSAPFQNDANTLLLLHMDGTDAITTFIDDNGVSTTHYN
jgi:hypothetical protein